MGVHHLWKVLKPFVRATFVFVFDGPGRPNIKRGRQVRPYVWWTHVVEELIHAFGFSLHHAPGEAEAELADLNNRRIVDAVITSDNDAFVFGAQQVIRPIPCAERRTPSSNLCGDEFEFYSAAQIYENLHLTRGGLILFALLCGGDYDSGIPHCGPAVSIGLSRCGYGDELANKPDGLGPDVDEETQGDPQASTQGFFDRWRQAVYHELVTNDHQHLPSRQPSIATSIQALRFPDPRVLSLYTAPLVSKADHYSLSWYLVREPLLTSIRDFWVIFPAIILRMLYCPLTLYNHELRRLLSPSLQVTITHIAWKLRKGRWRTRYGDTRQPKLTFNTSALLTLMGLSSQEQDNVTHVWVPMHALPNELRPGPLADHQLEVAQSSRSQMKAETIKQGRVLYLILISRDLRAQQ
ncbi:hypothetical protein CVT24_005460 [Panaeolus cyanescens]|uniref:XPG-I domain-containing protein n=1 Tax=Panaeolus cyanescens TaxID=181874 RepID=A0A409YC45_9AGAR|nr:hypothetical protein CVT24_005460 [Panaeolus cyanescens]